METMPEARPSSSSNGFRLRLLPFNPLKIRLPVPGIPVLRMIRLGSKNSTSGNSASKVSSQASYTATSLIHSPSTSDNVISGSASTATTSQQPLASTTAPHQGAANPTATVAQRPKPATRPVSDVFAGGLARALSQSTIHPIDTWKVRMQAKGAAAAMKASSVSAAAPAVVRGLSKFGQLVPPPVTGPDFRAMSAGLANLYKGVVGAASGAGIAIGAYFACYGVASNVISSHTDLSPSAVAFVSGGLAAAGSSVVKVPLAVCIRSVQAGVYPNVFAAANSITAKAGPRGLFTGFFPTLLEDVPDMAVKFAAYESLRQLHRRANSGRAATPQEDFVMGAFAGALAAASTTPLDVIKTRMMCAAASRPSMMSAARDVLATAGPKGFLTGIGARALSNGINSAVFFCFFEAIRSAMQARPQRSLTDVLTAWAQQAQDRAAQVPRMLMCAVGTITSKGTGGGYGGNHPFYCDLPHLRPLLKGRAGGFERSGGNGSMQWATVGATGDGMALLAGAHGPQTFPAMHRDDGELLLSGATSDYDTATTPARASMSLSLLARASPLRLDDSQFVMAMQALKTVEDSTNMPLDED
eukprot:GHRR01001206.1.p1 GENE.GHRR01001206.1~~GHRR01001206.1.p1  ORF type:complete len:585 (+),score=212.30 GHRR01001206.1:753-2507(+)